MAITPIDIQQHQFKTRPIGYEKYGVDEFLEALAEEVEKVLRQNQELREELARTRAALDEMKQRETTLKETLVTTQKMVKDIKANANKEADIIFSDAQLKAERIVRDADERRIQLITEIQEIRDGIPHLERLPVYATRLISNAFINQFKGMFKEITFGQTSPFGDLKKIIKGSGRRDTPLEKY